MADLDAVSMHECFFLRKYFPYAQFAIELIKNNYVFSFTKYIACTVMLLYIFKFILFTIFFTMFALKFNLLKEVSKVSSDL